MIKISNLNKAYNEKVIYKNFNLEVEKDKILVVLGESGSGKTTLLRVLANLTDYQVDSEKFNLDFSMMFQSDRLINNLTVKQNLSLFCSDDNLIDTLLKKVNLYESKDCYPKTLSGGMARRVAFLRAILVDKPVLLLDEPFINMDLALKFSLLELLKKRQQKKPQTIVLVTHDIKEACFIADRIVVLKSGNIVYDKINDKADLESELFELMLNIGDK